MGSSYEKGDCDSHGVSAKWIRKTLSTPNKNTGNFGPTSSGQKRFDANRNEKKAASLDKKGNIKGGDKRQVVADKLRSQARAQERIAAGAKPSGWDKWKAKKGHKMGFGMTHGYDDGEETYGNEHEYK